MARRGHPRDVRRGPRDRWRAPVGPGGRSPPHRPASTSDGVESGKSLGRPPAQRAPPARRYPPAQCRRSTGPAGSPRPTFGGAAGGSRAARSRFGTDGGHRRIDRPPPRACPALLDPSGPGHRRAANGGDRRAEPFRPAGEAGGASDPLRERRRTRRVPRSGRVALRRPPVRRAPLRRAPLRRASVRRASVRRAPLNRCPHVPSAREP
jgi:hypothetical protein